MENRWQAVGQAITHRIDALHRTKAEIIRLSGVSDKTLDGYMAGKPIVRKDKMRDLCAALGWTPDSIDRLLRARRSARRAGGPSDQPTPRCAPQQ